MALLLVVALDERNIYEGKWTGRETVRARGRQRDQLLEVRLHCWGFKVRSLVRRPQPQVQYNHFSFKPLFLFINDYLFVNHGNFYLLNRWTQNILYSYHYQFCDLKQKKGSCVNKFFFFWGGGFGTNKCYYIVVDT